MHWAGHEHALWLWIRKLTTDWDPKLCRVFLNTNTFSSKHTTTEQNIYVRPERSSEFDCGVRNAYKSKLCIRRHRVHIMRNIVSVTFVIISFIVKKYFSECKCCKLQYFYYGLFDRKNCKECTQYINFCVFSRPMLWYPKPQIITRKGKTISSKNIEHRKTIRLQLQRTAFFKFYKEFVIVIITSAL